MSPTKTVASSPGKEKDRARMERFTFTLGKLDAGMAILLGPSSHLLEFPSLLLPTSPHHPPLGPGSILTITVSRDLAAEERNAKAFSDLQEEILRQFSVSPKPPVLRVKNTTQTGVVLEWDDLQCGSGTKRGVEMWKNGTRWGRVGDKKTGKGEVREWKTGGLQSGEEYKFQLVLKTTAGTFPSNVIRIRTHTMDNLTGLRIAFGPISPPSLLPQLRTILDEIGAKETPGVSIDTTHFVCTTPFLEDGPAAGQLDRTFQEAQRVNLPCVGVGWLLAVRGESKLVPISTYIVSPPPSHLQTQTHAQSALSLSLPSAHSSQHHLPSSQHQPPEFRRADSSKRGSLPTGSPTEMTADMARSPSPETIARMSMVQSSGSGSGSSSGGYPGGASGAALAGAATSRHSIAVDGSQRSPSARPGGRSEASADGSVIHGRELDGRRRSTPLDVSLGRPHTPRKETEGKLDRGFKFPLATQGGAGASAEGATGNPGGVDQQGESVVHDSPEPEAKSELPSEPPAYNSSEGPAPASSSAARQDESTAVPGPPASTSAVSEEGSALVHGAKHASTIDEAISNFHEAVSSKPVSPGPTAPPPAELVAAAVPPHVESDASGTLSPSDGEWSRDKPQPSATLSTDSQMPESGTPSAVRDAGVDFDPSPDPLSKGFEKSEDAGFRRHPAGSLGALRRQSSTGQARAEAQSPSDEREDEVGELTEEMKDVDLS